MLSSFPSGMGSKESLICTFVLGFFSISVSFRLNLISVVHNGAFLCFFKFRKHCILVRDYDLRDPIFVLNSLLGLT